MILHLAIQTPCVRTQLILLFALAIPASLVVELCVMVRENIVISDCCDFSSPLQRLMNVQVVHVTVMQHVMIRLVPSHAHATADLQEMGLFA